MKNYLVSVVMPVYNSSCYLHSAISSVLSQSYSNLELIVINDCSADDSLYLIKKYESRDKRIIVIENSTNRGAAFSRNLGVRKARGKFLFFLDSDDFMSPNFIESNVDFICRNNCEMVFSNYYRFSDEEGTIQLIKGPKTITYKGLLKSCVINTNTVALDLRKVKNVSFPEEYKREDYALWLDLLKNGRVAYNSHVQMSFYRIHKFQGSGKKMNMARENWKILREKEQIPYLKSIFYFFCYSFFGFTKKYFPNAYNKLISLEVL